MLKKFFKSLLVSFGTIAVPFIAASAIGSRQVGKGKTAAITGSADISNSLQDSALINSTWQKYPVSKIIHATAPPQIYAKDVLSQYSPTLKNIDFKLLRIYDSKGHNVTKYGLDIPPNKKNVKFYLTYPKEGISEGILYLPKQHYRFPSSGYATFTYDNTQDEANKSNPFSGNAQIGNMKIWRMEKDENGKQLSMSSSGYNKMNPYNGVILPLGTIVTNDIIKSLLKDQSTTSTISWDKIFDKNKKGVYTATINQNSKKIYFKIYVTGPEFNFVREFWHKTLPYNFLIPDNVTSIESDNRYYLFESTILNSDFVIPKKVTEFGDYVFGQTILNDNFTIPERIKSFGDSTFFSSVFNKYFRIPSSITNFSSKNLFEKSEFGAVECLEIPEGVKEIGDSIFKSAHIKSLKLNGDLKKIGPYAFQGATIDNGFKIPDSVTDIGEYAFSNVSKLPQGFKLNNSLENIQEGVFSGTALNDDFVMPSKLSKISEKAFTQSKLNKNFIIPNSVKEIEGEAFSDVNLNKKFRLPNNLKNYSYKIFSNSKFNSIDFDDSSLTTVQKANDLFDQYSYISDTLLEFFESKNVLFNWKNSSQQLDSLKTFNLIKDMFNQNSKHKNDVFNKAILDNFITSISPTGEGLKIDIKDITKKGSGTLTKIVKWDYPSLLINSTWQNYLTSKTINTIAPPKIYAKDILSQYSPLLKNINFKLLKLYNDKNQNVTEEGLDIPSNKKIISFYLTYPKDGVSYSSNDVYRFPSSGYATFTYNKTFNLANKSNPFADNAQIGNMKIWRMEKDEYGQQLSMSSSGYSKMNPYNGVILPLGTSVTDSLIKSLLKDQSTTSTISWDKIFDKNKKGVYTATINQNSKKIYFKIYVTGPEFNFVREFWHKTLPYNFLIPNNVTSIKSNLADYLFERTILNPDFVIPKTVKKIGQLAFARTTLKDAFTIPDGVEKFEERTFLHVIFNKYFKIPSSVKDLSAIEIFQNADFSSTKCLEIPEGVTEIGESIFKGAHIKSLKLNSDLKKIGPHAFQGATIDNGFKIPDSVTDIGGYAFSNISKLPQGFKLNNSLENIRESVFSGTALNDDFVMPSKLTKISDKAFAQSKLNKNFIMPNSVKEIEDKAFSDANLNKKFRLSNNLKNYSYKIFNNSKFNSIDFDDSSLTTVQKANDLFDQHSYISNTLLKFFETKNVSFYKKYYNQKLDSLKAFNLIKNMFNKNPKYKNYFFSKSIIDKFITSISDSSTGFTINMMHIYDTDRQANKTFTKTVKWAKPSTLVNKTWEKYPISKTIHTIAPPKIYAKDILSQYSPLLKNIDFKLLKLYNLNDDDVTEQGLSTSLNKKIFHFYLTYPKDVVLVNTTNVYTTDVYRFPSSGYATFTYDTTFNLANKSNPFADNAQIGNMKIWRMEKDEKGQQLSMSLSGYSKMNPYNGVILPLGTSVTDSLIKSLLKDQVTTSTISWDKNYDKNKKGVYTATINQNSKKIYFKIYVTGPEFSFVHEFWHKTLPYNFLIPSNVTSIKSDISVYNDYLFEETVLNPDFVIPKNVTKLGIRSFSLAILNDSFSIPEGVTIIGERAFVAATLNDYFTFPKTITSIEVSAFSHIKKLPKGFKLPNSIKSISKSTFRKTTLNDDFFIPNNIGKIGQYAFQHAILNDDFFIPENVKFIGNYAFSVIEKLPKGFKLPNTISEISEDMFWKTTLNEDFLIPNSVSKILDSAFWGANLNKKFRLPNNLEDYSNSIVGEAKFDSIDLDYSSLSSVAQTNERFDEISFIKETLLKYLNIDKSQKDSIDKQIFKDNSSFEKFDSLKIFNLIKKVINNNNKYNNYNFNKKILDSIIDEIQYKNEGLEMNVHNIQGPKSVLVKVKRSAFSDIKDLDKDVQDAYNEFLDWLKNHKGYYEVQLSKNNFRKSFAPIKGLITNKPLSSVIRSKFNQIALDSLSGGGLPFPTFSDKKILLDYSHDGIDQNGDLEVRVFITKEHATTQESKIIFNIGGIDEAKANKANADISLAKDEIEKLSISIVVNKKSIPAVAPGTTFNAKALKELFGPSTVFPTIPSGVNITYSHNGINNNGNLVVIFEIKKSPGTQQTKKINLRISGIDEAKANADILLAKDEIEKLSASITVNKTNIAAVASGTAFDKDVLEEFLGPSAVFPKLPSGLKLSYSHNGLNNDGTLKIDVKIEKSLGKTQIAKLNITVNGINKAKANKDITSIQNIISNWPTANLDVLKAILPVSNVNFDANELKNLTGSTTPQFVFPKNLNGVVLTYTHSGISTDGLLNVQIKIKKYPGDTKTSTLKVQVGGIIRSKANDDINFIKDQIQKLTGSLTASKTSVSAVSSGVLFTRNTLKSFGGNASQFPSDLKGTKLTYTHGGAAADGDIDVHVKIEKSPGSTQTAIFKVAVKGIDKIIANRDILSVQNIIKTWNNTALTTNKTSISAVPTGTIFDKDVLEEFLGQSAVFPKLPSGVILTYAHDGLDRDGTLKVIVNISKPKGKTVSQDFDVEISGIEASIANRDILSVQNIIKTWTKATLKTSELSIPGILKQEPFDKKALSALAPNISFPTLPDGVSLTYTHNALSKDDTLKVHIKISKAKGKTVTQVFNVEVSGIDNAILNRYIKIVHDQIKNLANVKLITTNQTSIASVTSPKKLDRDAWKTLTTNTNYPNVPNFVNLKYTHGGINHDGTLTIRVEISQSKATTVTENFDVEVSGIDKAKANADIKAAQQTIKSWGKGHWNTKKTFINKVIKKELLNPDPFIKAISGSSTFPIFPKGVSISYSHDSLDHDDTLAIHFKISKTKGKTIKEDFIVQVTGIEAAVSNLDIKSIQNHIIGWPIGKLNTTQTSIPAVANPKILDEQSLSSLASNLKFPILPRGIILTYTHGSLNHDDTLAIRVKISKAKGTTITQYFDVQVTGIDNSIKKSSNHDIKLAQNQIKDWPIGKLNTTQTSIPAVINSKTLDKKALSALAPNISFPTLPKGVTLTYTHDELDHDDTLAINVKIAKAKGKTVTQVFNVDVSGIDKVIANLDIKSVQNQIKGWPKGVLTTTQTSIPAVTNPKILDEQSLSLLASNLKFPILPRGIILTYTHGSLNHDDTLKVRVTISKAKGTPKTEVFQSEVSGFDKVIANHDIKLAQNQIKDWPIGKLTTTQTSIPAVTNPKILDKKALTALSPNLAFPTLPKGVTLTYTHDYLDHDDTLAINVKIAKAKGKTVTQVFNVEVSGIDNSKKIKVDADIAFVKKEIINIGLGHLTPLSFIKEVQYPKTFNSDVLKSFGPTLKFPKNIKGTELTYTHLALNKDGLLPIYIKISKKYGTTVTQIFQVQVSGFDKVIANHDIKSVQNQIKGWPKGVLTTTQTSIPAVTNPKILDKKALSALAPNLSFLNVPKNVILTYAHDGLDHDDNLIIHVQISKAKGKTETQDFIVQVTGIEVARLAQANHDIKSVQNQIKDWPKGVLTTTQTSIPAETNPKILDKKALSTLAPNLAFPTLPDGVSLTYTHDGLYHDDTLTVHVKISKAKGTTITQDFKVEVSGIDKVIANHDIKSVQNQIKGWHIGKLNTTQASIPAVTNPKILDEQSLGSLASNLKFPILPRGIVLTYTHGSLSHDDTLKVRVTISKAKGTPKTEVFQSEVSGIETAIINKDIKTVQDKIKGLTKAALTIVNKTSIPAVSTPKPFDSNALSALAPNLTFPTLPKGVSLTYTHNGIDHDGILKVQVNINHSKGIKKVQGFGIKVKGINALKMVIANGNIKLVQDQIKTWSTDTIIVDHIIKNKSSATPFDKNALNSLAPHLIYPTVPKGVTLTYTHNGLDHDDTLIIYVKIEKFPGRTETQDFRVKIKGINKVVARAKADIKLVQDKIKGLTKVTLATTKTSIPAVSSPAPFDEKTLSAIAPNLKFPNLPKDVTITYTHQGLVKDGTLQLQVNINHAKGLKSVNTFDLKISGINKAKEIKANKDIKYVQDQVKKWTNVSFNEKRTFIPKVSEDTPLNSKALKSIAPNLTFPTLPKGVTLTYYHKGIEKNGTLKVHVKIEKSSGKTIVQDFDVKVTGVYNPWNLSGGLDYSKTNIIITSFLTELFLISLILLAKIIKLKKK